jgi:2-keto-4-pentenoate hydratase/2-oxohepta-3-ene-1,7-dioic acid hydratase in catechol pathway
MVERLRVGIDRPPVLTPAGRYVTLQPGDLIFTGTAGKTQPIMVGDVVEVELLGAGVLRNKVAAGK